MWIRPAVRRVRRRRGAAALRVLPPVVLLVLLAGGGGLPGSAAAPGAAAPPEPPVTPAVVTERLDPGESLRVAKQVRTPAIPPKPDIVLLVDGTASMAGGTLENVQKNLHLITEAVRAEQPDSRFAVASFGDQEGDEEKVYTVHQPLTDDLALVQRGVDALPTDRGGLSMGPSEDWNNALWQIAHGSGGATVFRPDSSPVVVLVGDASTHDPSKDHTLTDTIAALQSGGIRVLAVDVATNIGDGLNGNGDAGDPEYIEDPLHAYGQATRVVDATKGELLNGIEEDAVAQAVVEGLGNLNATVGHRQESCDPGLTVTLDPPTRTVESGESAAFDETIQVAPDAPQGRRLTCVIQFLMGTGAPDARSVGPRALAEPDLTETINIDVNDVEAPVVTVDDRTVATRAPGGAPVSFTATAEDANDGPLPVSCTPASGSVFPVGRTTVTCSATDSNGNTGSDTATVEVLRAPVPPTADVAVNVRVTPARTYTGRPATARYTLSNAGPDAASGVILTSAWPRTPDAGDRTLAVRGRCTPTAPCSIPAGGRIEVTQRATYRTAVNGEVVATAVATLPDREAADNTDRDTLRVLQPKLTVTPQVAEPGDVVLARGTDYPPGARVRLTWSAGITAAVAPMTVGGDGTFEAQTLVLRKDRIGPRDLRAEVTGVDRLSKPVLIVQRKLQPPDFEGRG